MRSRIALVAALMALAACGDDGGAAITSTTTTVGTTSGPTTTTATTVALGEPGFSWIRLAVDEPSLATPDEEEIESVIAGADILVGIGSARLADDNSAAVWTSVDGTAWTRVPHDEVLFGGVSSQGMHAGVFFENAFVAVGFDYAISDAATAVVWRSSDGQTWERVPNDEAVFGGPDSQIMLGVVAGGPGLVAVGWDASGGESDGAVWTSPDGMTWTRVPHDEAVFGGAGRQAIESVVVGGPGLVAVGRDEAAGDFDAAVWVSADGITWERVEDPDGVLGGAADQFMTAVYPEGSPMIATGYTDGDGGRDALVWISGDGTSWELADLEALGGANDQYISSLIRYDGIVVAAGSEYVAASDSETPMIWFSTDHGLSWTRSDDPMPSDGQYEWVEFLTPVGDSILAIGGVGGEEDIDIVVWIIEVTFE